jgi:O-antigen biosynthesis protein
MTLDHRVAPLLALIAPHGSARRAVLRFSRRAVRVAPKLLKPRFVRQKLASLRARSRLRWALRSYQEMPSAAVSQCASILSTLSFPVVDQPRVSVIVRVCGQSCQALECLQSISVLTGEPAFEVIVVEDRSGVRDFRLLSGIPGAITLSRGWKPGTISARNRGALRSRGEYLAFLNQDARATPGWLAALTRTFEDIPGTALAGTKLISSDGRLLEAGAALSPDGSGLSYGRFDDPGHPRFNFAREVDYFSTGCFMVPRLLFLTLGGYGGGHDSSARAEIDLAARIRHAGHKVIYQPLAKVIQHEQSRTPEAAPANLDADGPSIEEALRGRMRPALTSHQVASPASSRAVCAASGGSHPLGRVLVIDHRIPTPDRDSASFRIMEFIRGIKRRGHHVTFLPDNMLVFAPYLEAAQRVGIEVIHPPYFSSAEEYLKLHGHEFALAILSRANIADRHMDVVRRYAPNARIVFDTVDLYHRREERQARIKESPELLALAASRKEQELRLARTADCTLVVSPIEKAVLEAECNHEIEVRVLSNILPVPLGEPPGYEARREILFIGTLDHIPNADAVLFFTREIFPRVLERIPEAVFEVIGSEPPPEISRLESSSVRILGYVPDVKPLFDRARISVAPLRFGAGVKGKVNQSMSFGVPTVVTSIAAEGMYLTDGEHALVADDPASFADAVVRLWTSPELWRKISKSGRRNLIEHFSVEASAKPIDDLLEWAGLSSTAK